MYAPNQSAPSAGPMNTRGNSPQGQQQVAEVLHLVLGPLHLDLLGLVVDLNKSVWSIGCPA